MDQCARSEGDRVCGWIVQQGCRLERLLGKATSSDQIASPQTHPFQIEAGERNRALLAALQRLGVQLAEDGERLLQAAAIEQKRTVDERRAHVPRPVAVRVLQ